MAQVGPVILVNAGDSFIDGCVIEAILWTGKTTAGDTCVLRQRSTNVLLWEGITNVASTYAGLAFPTGTHCPFGFYLSQISAGTLKIYIKQA